MKYTSAEANKLLKTLENKRNNILRREDKASKFKVSSTENVEDLRPEYDFAKTQKELALINAKIRKIKHAINMFNVTLRCRGLVTMTIDRAGLYASAQRRNKKTQRHGVFTPKGKDRRLPLKHSRLFDSEFRYR